LYLPESWTEDKKRRKAGGIPEETQFQTKPQIALAQIKKAVEEEVARGVVVADAGYGVDGRFRAGITELGLEYAVGVQSSLTVWAPGTEPLLPSPRKQTGRPPSLLRRDKDHQPVSAKQLASDVSTKEWKTVNWRQGTEQKLRSRFAAVRVRSAHRDYWQSAPHAEEWLLVEWPKGEAEPAKYWLSTLPADTKLKDLVAIAKQRWIIERDYEELKQELGLGHYERQRLAGISSSRHTLHCLLWLLDSRAKPFFPLRPRRKTGTTRRANSCPLPAPRSRAFEPSGITPLPSPLFASASRDHLFTSFPVVRFCCELRL
jgi:SRSO17 transposase